MTDKELKRMNRQELLNELYKYARENADLHLRLENMEEEYRQHLQKVKEEVEEEKRKTEQVREDLKIQESRNAELAEKLRNRTIVLKDAGNIADATCKMTGIFEEAQKTAEIYLQNVKEMTERQEKVLLEMEEKSRQDIQKMGDEASRTCNAMRKQIEKECSELKQKTEEQCRAMEADAYSKAEEYWNHLKVRLEKFYDAHQGMRELFGDDLLPKTSYKDYKKDL